MPKRRPKLTTEDIYISLLWLEEMERAQISQRQMAVTVGLSESQFSRRLALARRYRQEEEKQGLRIDLALAPNTEPDDDRPVVGGEDVEWLQLVNQHEHPGDHGYYDLDTDRTSHDGTTDFVLVGTGRGGMPRRNRLGTGAHVPAGNRYRAEDDGLKGGVG